MHKSEFLNRLRELVGEGRTEEALDFLEANIKDFTAFFSNDIVMLKSQFVSAKSQFLLKGLIENSEFARITARVNFAILEIGDKIEKKTETSESKRRGHLLHKIPSKMVKEKETKCIIRIAYLLEQLIVGLTIDEDTIFQAIQVTCLMSVELIDDNEINTFEIRTSTDEEQFIINEECTQWIFKVRPLRIGCFPLLLKIGAVEVINGKERKRNIIIEKEIKITVESLQEDETDFTVISLENENYLTDIRAEKERKNQEFQRLEKERLAAMEEAKRNAEKEGEQKNRKEEEKRRKLEAERQKREAEEWYKYKRRHRHREESHRQRREESHRHREERRRDSEDYYPVPKHSPSQDMIPDASRKNSSCSGILFLIIIIIVVALIWFFFFNK